METKREDSDAATAQGRQGRQGLLAAAGSWRRQARPGPLLELERERRPANGSVSDFRPPYL